MPIPGFDSFPAGPGITSACHCSGCGSRLMVWLDGSTTTHHYANRSEYLGTTEPECIEAELADLEPPFTLLQPQPQPMTTATFQRIEQKIQSMIGQTFLFMQDKDPHTILNYDLRNNRLIISSDRRMFNFEAKNAPKLLEAFRLVEAIEPQVEPKSRAEEIFEGVMSMAQGPVSEQPEPVEVPNEPEAGERLEAEVMEALPESEHTCAKPIVEEMKELAKVVVEKARELKVVYPISDKSIHDVSYPPFDGIVSFNGVPIENPGKAAGKSVKDSPWPIALYSILTPIVSDYQQAMDRVRHYRDARSRNNPIYLHRDEGAVDAETAEAIYTLAIERAQQQMQETEKEFRQVIVDYIGITREL